MTRLATPMLVASGVAADLDWLGRLGGARLFLHSYRVIGHSFAGTVAMIAALASISWWLTRRGTHPVRFPSALVVCAAGAAAHLVLDLGNSDGLKLFWPFSEKWYAWDILDTLDPWVLAVLLMGLLLPSLFGLVTEEIGGRPKRRGPQRAAMIALALLTAYCGARAVLHHRALEVLKAHLYHGATPLNAAALPTGTSPLTWAGVVETDNTLEEIEVSLAPAARFDPDAARRHFKPEAAALLEAARKSPTATAFLEFARLPQASVEKTMDGYTVELRDLRFALSGREQNAVLAIIELNPQLQVINEELRLGRAKRK
jgi:inner membrane protein